MGAWPALWTQPGAAGLGLKQRGCGGMAMALPPWVPPFPTSYVHVTSWVTQKRRLRAWRTVRSVTCAQDDQEGVEVAWA